MTSAPIWCVLLLASITAQLAVGVETRWLTGLALVSGSIFWLFVLRAAVVGTLTVRWLFATAAAALLICVLFAPASSLDVNSYAAYGRMVSAHDASPFTHAPQDFPADVWSTRVSPYWADSPSVYGPLFNRIAGAVMAVAGTSYTVARVGFQLIAGAAFLAIGALLWRFTHRREVVVFFTLNPIVLTFGVNDAHCDILIGVAVLGAAVALGARRLVVAGALIGVATLIKISAVPAIAGLAVWSWWKLGRRSAVITSVTAVLMAVVGYALANPADVLQAIEIAAGRHSRFSVFAPLYGVLDQTTSWSTDTLETVVSRVSLLTVAVVGLVIIVRSRKAATASLALAAGLVSYQVLGAYTLAWYVLWSLPVLALVWRSKLAWLAIGHATFLAIAYFSGFLGIAFVAVLLLAFVWRAVGRRRSNIALLGGSSWTS